jgi:hypothetical protein
MDSLPEGGGECLCPNCGSVLRKGTPADPGDRNTSSTDMSASATHLKIAKKVNVGFGDFASVLAATNASKIVPTDTGNDEPDRTRTASSSRLNVEEPDDDDALSPLDVYDEDDEYARIQADIAARKKALDVRSAELDTREKYLNKKLDEIISEKEFLRTGIEKTDKERASFLKQKDVLEIRRAELEKEFAARKASLDARAAEIDRKAESLGKTRAALEDLKRELDSSLSGDKNSVDHTSSSVSIPYSAKLLRQNNRLMRNVRILKRVQFCLCILILILIVILFDSMWKNNEHEVKMKAKQVEINLLTQQLEAARAEGAASADNTSEMNNIPAPESETSGGGL